MPYYIHYIYYINTYAIRVHFSRRKIAINQNYRSNLNAYSNTNLPYSYSLISILRQAHEVVDRPHEDRGSARVRDVDGRLA